MGLVDLALEPEYRSGEHNILNQLFRPSLRVATEYWRAVGYFSSSALEAFGKPLSEFVANGGRIRLITSVELREEDVQAIEQGMNRQEVCERRISEIIEDEFSIGVRDGVKTLSTLLSVGRLDIRIAVPSKGSGIYHEKVGIFLDESEFVAFSGSANESKNALEQNYECIDVYPNWELPGRAERKRQHFEKLWNNNSVGVEVFRFPDAAANQLIRLVQSGIREESPAYTVQNAKWRHQDEAIDAFLSAEQGILDMATGTGKTRTALRIVRTLLDRDQIDTIIISTFGTDLLNQWYSEVLRALSDLVKPLTIHRHFSEHYDRDEFSLSPKDSILLSSRASVDKALNNLTPAIAQRTLLIHDEVHGLGSHSSREALNGLSDDIRFRLGLSATPEREYDEEGNDFVESHIGPVLFNFGLTEAIERGILAPFNYYPLEYEITSEDRDKVRSVHAMRAARAKEGKPMTNEEVWTAISRIYKCSPAKIPVFRGFIETHQHLLERCIIFVETQEYGDEILEIVHKYRPDFHTYFSGEDSDTLRRFASGDLECLITCHRLSEGIDIQSLNTVILFSSARARLETIQRIGRCIRTNPADPDKIANIVDFIRVDAGDGMNADEERSAWLTELSNLRVLE